METLRTTFISIGSWTYLLVGLDIFLESSFLGFLLPGASIVILMGVLAGDGIVSLRSSAALVVTCAFVGDLTGYLLGRYRGGQILDRVRWFRKQYEERRESVESYARRFGAGIILVGRFLPLIRAITPFAMGLAGMKLSRFIPSALLSSLIWADGFFTIGVVFSQHWRFLDSILAPIGDGLTAAVISAIFGWAGWKHRERLRGFYYRFKSRIGSK
jgi:membrane protein DedA with SNARE-associated domain